MKKTILFILAALVLVTMLAIPAMAADGTVSVSPVTGKSGEIVTVTVSLAGFEQANTIGIDIQSPGMELIGGEWLMEGTLASVDLNKNKAAWTKSGAYDLNRDVLKLSFKLPEYDGTNSYSVQITAEVKMGNTSKGKPTTTGTVTVKNPAQSVTLDKTTLALDLSGTKTGTLSATVTPSYTSDALQWSSSNASVASVSGGTVTALKTGTATITATAGSKSATCTVTVTCSHKNAVETKAKQASCQATGNNAYWTCNDCGKVLKADKRTETTVAAETLAKVNHSGGTATCTAKPICSMCNTAYGSTKQHSYSSAWKSDATNHWHICTTCNTQKSGVAKHNFTWVVDKPATENATGLKHEKCATCGYQRSQNTVIPKLDHTHGDIKHFAAVKATCVKAGTVEYWTCGKAKCAGKYYADANCQIELKSITEPINPNNHTGKTEVKGKVEATCSKAGYTGDTYCLSCKAISKKGTEVAATGKHTPKSGYQKDDNQHWQLCSQCNEIIGKKANHSYKWVTDKKATEQATGLKHEACVCGQERSKNTVIDKLPHIPEKVEAKNATCTEEGAKEHFYCPNCDGYYASENGAAGEAIQKDSVISPALGHSYGTEWLNDANGHWHVCSACSAKSEVEAHTAEVVGALEATEEQEGYTGDSVCSACKYEISKGQTIPVIGQEPTETQPAAPDAQPGQSDNGDVVIAVVVILALALCGGGAFLLIKKPWKK